MTDGGGVALDTIVFVGGNSAASRAFYGLAMGHARGGESVTPCVSFVPAGDVPTPQSGSWVPCLDTADIAVAGRRVLEFGARTAGMISIDGQSQPVYAARDGALFTLREAANLQPRTERLGDVAFVDLYTPLALESATYFAEALSYNVIHEDVPTPGDYRLLASGDRPVAGVVDMLDVLPTVVPSHWIPYLRVVDLESEVARLSDLGARVRVPATDSAVGPFALLVDPFGVSFGLQTPASDDLLRRCASIRA